VLLLPFVVHASASMAALTNIEQMLCLQKSALHFFIFASLHMLTGLGCAAAQQATTASLRRLPNSFGPKEASVTMVAMVCNLK